MVRRSPCRGRRDRALAAAAVCTGVPVTIQSPRFRSYAPAPQSPDRAGTLAASRWLPAAGPAAPVGVPVPDLADPLPANGSDDEVWMLSYMDIMTLLLTLLVLLFVYTQAVVPEAAGVGAATGGAQPIDAGREALPMARVADLAVLGPEGPVPLPPRWLGSLVEPPIPELAVWLGDAPEDVGVTSPTAGDEATSDIAAPAAVAAPSENTAFPADRAAVGTPDSPPGRPAVDEPPTGTIAPPERVEQSLLAAVRASELGRRVEVTRQQDAVNLEISDEILFDRGSAEVRLGGEALLAELARLLAQQGLTISVEGHTDNVPIRNARFASNWELSAARATAVTRQLVAHAVDPARVRAVGHADTKPRGENGTAEGRARNRRVTLVLHVPAV